MAASSSAALVPMILRLRLVVEGNFSRIGVRDARSGLLVRVRVLRVVRVPTGVISVTLLLERSREVRVVTSPRAVISVILLPARLRVVRAV